MAAGFSVRESGDIVGKTFSLPFSLVQRKMRNDRVVAHVARARITGSDPLSQ